LAEAELIDSYYRTPDGKVALLHGHVLDVLKAFPAESVNCVVTSPPYWSKREYDGPNSQWDGWLGKYGSELTPELYAEHTMMWMREIFRILQKDGTVWLNIGDGYTNGQVNLISFHIALAAQADGWWIRSVIIWHKPNGKPESVHNRPTQIHEYIFLLTKNKKYWYDADAVREPHISNGKGGFSNKARQKTVRFEQKHAPSLVNMVVNSRGRNCRSVWNISTQPYHDIHFAAFPRTLPERCIKAGCPDDGIVLDPFVGSGTTCEVAHTLGRKSVGIDNSAKYLDMAIERINKEVKVG